EVECDWRCGGDWLYGECTGGPANQDVSARADTNPKISRCADVFASQRTCCYAAGRCKDRPTKHSAGTDADVDTHSIERALISLRRTTFAGDVTAFHRLVTSYDEANARIEFACKHAHLRPSLGSLRRRRRSKDQCGQHGDTYRVHND